MENTQTQFKKLCNPAELHKQFSQAREQRARAILEKGTPEIIDENHYLVPSEFDSTRKYQVTHLDSYSCNCKDFELRCRGRSLYCKHIRAILLFEKIKSNYESKEVVKEFEIISNAPQKESCPECHSENLIRSGIRKTKTEVKQRYECRDCKKRFVLSPIPKIKGNEKLVCLAMDCYFKGLSYRDIADQFMQFYGLKLSHETIRSWVLKFSSVIERYSRGIKPKTSGTWNADETLVMTKRGVDKEKPTSNYDYLWNVVDNKSKFLLASECSGRSRSKKDAQHVFEVAREQSKDIPKEIVTDRYAGYTDGIRRTFNYKNWGKPENKVKHISIVGQRKVRNNNAVESHHSTQKEFHKVRRGVTRVQDYANGYKIFHNYIRKGANDKKTPAEKCGIKIENLNRWEGLLLESLK